MTFKLSARTNEPKKKGSVHFLPSPNSSDTQTNVGYVLIKERSHVILHLCQENSLNAIGSCTICTFPRSLRVQ